MYTPFKCCLGGWWDRSEGVESSANRAKAQPAILSGKKTIPSKVKIRKNYFIQNRCMNFFVLGHKIFKALLSSIIFACNITGNNQ